MTGAQWKAFAAQIPDECVVELELAHIQQQFREWFDRRRYSVETSDMWVALPTVALRVIVTPDIVQAARVAAKLTDASLEAS